MTSKKKIITKKKSNSKPPHPVLQSIVEKLPIELRVSFMFGIPTIFLLKKPVGCYHKERVIFYFTKDRLTKALKIKEAVLWESLRGGAPMKNWVAFQGETYKNVLKLFQEELNELLC